jgi:hypothetical protein
MSVLINLFVLKLSHVSEDFNILAVYIVRKLVIKMCDDIAMSWGPGCCRPFQVFRAVPLFQFFTSWMSDNRGVG